jgi:hypothetical protein
MLKGNIRCTKRITNVMHMKLAIISSDVRFNLTDNENMR